MGDAARVEQVLNNLAANAFKHWPEGTPVGLGARAGGEHVSIDAVDPGVGIEPDLPTSRYPAVRDR